MLSYYLIYICKCAYQVEPTMNRKLSPTKLSLWPMIFLMFTKQCEIKNWIWEPTFITSYCKSFDFCSPELLWVFLWRTFVQIYSLNLMFSLACRSTSKVRRPSLDNVFECVRCL